MSVNRIRKWVFSKLCDFVAYRIDTRSLLANLERLHTGASAEWASGLRESRGRHAAWA
jgi:hypothetical protein